VAGFASKEVVVEGPATMDSKHSNSSKNGRRRCRSCKQLFTPDPRCRFHQRFCPKDECQKASKAESQQKYRLKLENLWHRQGEKLFAKLGCQPSNSANSPLWPNVDEKTRQEAFNWGLMVVLTGGWSQVLIERMYRNLLAAGREILRKKTEAATRAAARVGGVARRQ
jgi:hypothetical protein